MEIRALTDADATVYQAVRLRSLREHPEAFGSSFEEEQDRTPEQIVSLLVNPSVRVCGAWNDSELVGIVAVSQNQRAKTRHRAMIGGMYVVPEARGQGIGRALIEAALDFARSCEGVEDVALAVTVGNDAARHLYVQAGFTTYSIDPRYIKTDGRYYDIEWMMLRMAGDEST